MQKIVSMCLTAVLVLAVSACGDDDGADNGSGDDASAASTTTTEPVEVGDRIEGLEIDGQPQLALEVVATGLRGPVDLAQPPGDDERLFFLERYQGKIRIVEDGEVLETPFLDIADRLEASQPVEEELQENGLISMTFHPDYANNGRFFIYYASLSGDEQIVEYQVSDDDPNRADPASAVTLREYGPARQHHGGFLAFGPDGALWFTIGDGGGGNKLSGPAGDIEDPRGALHRFDASTPGELGPADGNPFVGDTAGVDDMWATGLRNAFSVAFDDGLIYIADVGESTIEEINVAPWDAPALDYGWPRFEGSICSKEPCQTDDKVLPVIELVRSEDPSGICAVIGGQVYRGDEIPALDGAYLYTDYCGGFLRSFRYEDGAATEEIEWFDDIGKVNTIEIANDGEILMVDKETSSILRLVPA